VFGDVLRRPAPLLLRDLTALELASARSGGERQYVPALARAAVAFGIDALFMEMHEDPDRTLPDGQPLSDGPNMLRIDDLPRLLDEILAIRQALHR
jgi:2-dehydro-3-deoxyphosphooctonate aldolase (KDO 8-P synthase)